VDEPTGLDKLFFELASESRLSILLELRKESAKMHQIATKLDLTDTEAFRQLHRLSEAFLISRNPDGTFSITPYGRLVLHLTSSYRFVSKNRESFNTRDVWKLPEQFVDRLGELENTTLSLDLVEMLNNSVIAFKKAEKFIWTMSDRPSTPLSDVITERIAKGVSFRAMYPERSRDLFKDVPFVKGQIEHKAILDIPVRLVCTEWVAGVNFYSIDGRADSALFYGTDPKCIGWVKDLFDYYWHL